MARLLRERVPAAARVLRRARPAAHRSRGADPDLAGGDASPPARSGSRIAAPTAGSTGSASFAPNDLLPGEPDATGREFTLADLLRRALRLIADFLASLPDERGRARRRRTARERAGRHRRGLVGARSLRRRAARSIALDAVNDALAALVAEDADLRRTWHLVAVMTTRSRAGCSPTGSSPAGAASATSTTRTSSTGSRVTARRTGWRTSRSSAASTTSCSPTAARHAPRAASAPAWPSSSRPRCSSSTAARSSGRWRPAWATSCSRRSTRRCVRRGVEFEFFHRVDALHLSGDRTADRRGHDRPPGALAPGLERYEPLVRVGGLPCFPSRPPRDQLDADPTTWTTQPLESHFCDVARRRDARRCAAARTSTSLVLAIPVGMAPHRLPRADRGPARVARDGRAPAGRPPPRPSSCGCARTSRRSAGPSPGPTVSAYESPLQHVGLDAAADRRASRGRRTTGRARSRTSAARSTRRGRRTSPPMWPRSGRACAPTPSTSSSTSSRICCPAARPAGRFRWDLLCGRDGHAGASAIDTQLCLANVDPSDRYVQCAPGTDALPAARRRERLRQPLPRRRLDRQRPQRRLHRGGDAVRPAGGQRRPRPLARPPDRRDLAQLTWASIACRSRIVMMPRPVSM